MSTERDPAIAAYKKLGKWSWRAHVLQAFLWKLAEMAVAVGGLWMTGTRQWGLATYCLAVWLVADRMSERHADTAGLEP